MIHPRVQDIVRQKLRKSTYVLNSTIKWVIILCLLLSLAQWIHTANVHRNEQTAKNFNFPSWCPGLRVAALIGESRGEGDAVAAVNLLTKYYQHVLACPTDVFRCNASSQHFYSCRCIERLVACLVSYQNIEKKNSSSSEFLIFRVPHPRISNQTQLMSGRLSSTNSLLFCVGLQVL